MLKIKLFFKYRPTELLNILYLKNLKSILIRNASSGLVVCDPNKYLTLIDVLFAVFC